MGNVLFGLDIGTTKVCAVVGEVHNGQLRIEGVGIRPAEGISKSMVVDVDAAAEAIYSAIDLAQSTSGYRLSEAFVSMAGEHVRCQNSIGERNISRSHDGVTQKDIDHALDMSVAVPLHDNRQIVHVVPRGYQIDDQPNVVNPLGMYGGKLSLETHIVTASETALLNLAKCVNKVGININGFVYNAMASAEAVLDPTERDMGVLVIDIGGGTTDIALYKDGAVWHTHVLPVGGFHVTNDIAVGLRVPYETAEQIKLQYGDCRPEDISPEYEFTVEPFGGERIQVGRQDLAVVIKDRVEELFELVHENIVESGFQGQLPAGVVLTGGSSQLRGIVDVANSVFNGRVRVSPPKNLNGLVDSLRSPAYATGVGLLRWAMTDHATQPYQLRRRTERTGRIRRLFGALLPE